jgi:hypothetical protein
MCILLDYIVELIRVTVKSKANHRRHWDSPQNSILIKSNTFANIPYHCGYTGEWKALHGRQQSALFPKKPWYIFNRIYGGHLNKSDVAVGATPTITKYHAVEVGGANSSHGLHQWQFKMWVLSTGETKFTNYATQIVHNYIVKSAGRQ